MQIQSNSWHAKVYKNWHQRKHSWNADIQSANLCPYVRVILFYSWARYLFRTGTTWPFWTGLVLAAEGVLYKIYGLKAFKAELDVLSCLALIALSTAVILGVAYCIVWVKDEAPNTTFGEVLVERAKSFHSGICPTIQFK